MRSPVCCARTPYDSPPLTQASLFILQHWCVNSLWFQQLYDSEKVQKINMSSKWLGRGYLPRTSLKLCLSKCCLLPIGTLRKPSCSAYHPRMSYAVVCVLLTSGACIAAHLCASLHRITEPLCQERRRKGERGR